MDKNTLTKANHLSTKIESTRSDGKYYKELSDSLSKRDIGTITITVRYREGGKTYTDDIAMLSSENGWVISMMKDIAQSKMNELQALEEEFKAL